MPLGPWFPDKWADCGWSHSVTSRTICGGVFFFFLSPSHVASVGLISLWAFFWGHSLWEKMLELRRLPCEIENTLDKRPLSPSYEYFSAGVEWRGFFSLFCDFHHVSLNSARCWLVTVAICNWLTCTDPCASSPEWNKPPHNGLPGSLQSVIVKSIFFFFFFFRKVCVL